MAGVSYVSQSRVQAGIVVTEDAGTATEVRGPDHVPLVTNDLARAVTALGEELVAHYKTAGAGGDPAAFSVDVEGTPRDLQPILRDDIYRITGEALRNALHHARARTLALSQKGGSGHRGMTGMRERAKRIGGQLDVWSDLGAGTDGTEVELRIPASIAYQGAYQGYASRAFRLFRRKVGTNS